MVHTFTFFVDPSHAWLQVSVSKLRELAEEILPEISPYSYMDIEKGMVYLEEDCDALRFVKAITGKGYKWDYREEISEERSFVRNLNKYKYPPYII
jgi:hypothetical protein